MEDDTLIATEISLKLAKAGYEVTSSAISGEQAVECATIDEPDLILMDLQLRGALDGIETATRIRTHCNIPIIYLTAYSDAESLERAKATEPYGFLSKPVHEDTLRTTIETALHKNKQESELKETNLRLEREIIDRKQAEIQASARRLQTVIETVGEGITLSDSNGYFEIFNSKMEEITGYTKEEVGQQGDFLSLLYPDRIEHQKAIAGIQEIAQTGGYRNVETTIRAKDGTNKTLLVSSAVMEYQNHDWFLSTYRDITDRKRADQERLQLEAQLRQSQKLEALGRLAGGIAHDFNNILGTIVGYTELLLEKHPEGDPESSYIDRVYRAGERAARLIQQILTFSRAQEHYRLSPTAIAPIIEEAIKMIRATTPANIEIRHQLHPNCHPILADPTQIHQVLINLCVNAIHAMKEYGGTLDITLEEISYDPDQGKVLGLNSDRHLKLTVSDTGCGMMPDVQEHIFEPFFTTKQQGEGSGLGLSVVHGIVNGHHGIIIVNSALDEGTTFQIFFPTTEEHIPKPETIPTEPARKGRESILIVDDERDLAELYEIMLSKHGYQVTILNDGLEALQAFRTNQDRFDLVFTDQAMPRMTGVHLSQELLRIRPDLPIILATGYSETISEDDAIALGIQRFLMKPVKARVLLRTIEEVLATVPQKSNQ